MQGSGGWAAWINGAAPARSLGYQFGDGFFVNMVYQDKSWDWRTFQAARDVPVADAKMAAVLNAFSADLGAFHARGGKLILYHGWSDPAITALSSIDYYRSVEQKMGAAAEGMVRLFLAPGMQHCGGGPGPNQFGQSPNIANLREGDAEHDINAAMERWVEQGVAPRRIVATSYKSPGVIERTRPLCPYPQTAHYRGAGSTDDAANFVCR